MSAVSICFIGVILGLIYCLFMAAYHMGQAVAYRHAADRAGQILQNIKDREKADGV